MASNREENKTFHILMKSKQRIYKPQLLATLKHQKLLEMNEKKLIRAVTTNNSEKVEELLSSNVNPNVSDNLQRTPLHLAASRSYKDIIGILLKYGADPNQRDIMGNTALHLAACSNNLDIITLLLDGGTDVTSSDKHGRNPLQLAQSKLRLLQDSRKEGAIELTQLRKQLRQVIDLMQSFFRRQSNAFDVLDIINLKLDDSSDAQLDDQMSLILAATEDISLK